MKKMVVEAGEGPQGGLNNVQVFLDKITNSNPAPPFRKCGLTRKQCFYVKAK